MAELVEIPVADGAVETQAGGVRAVAVVQFERTVERVLVLDIEVDVHGARLDTGTQHGSDTAVAEAVQPDDFLLHLLHVRHVSFGERGGGGLDPAGQEIPRAVHAQAADFSLDDIQPDDPAAGVLLGNDDGNGLETLVVIRLFQGDARGLDIIRRASGTEVRIDGLLDGETRKTGRAVDPVFADVQDNTPLPFRICEGDEHGERDDPEPSGVSCYVMKFHQWESYGKVSHHYLCPLRAVLLSQDFLHLVKGLPAPLGAEEFLFVGEAFP